MKLLIPIDQNKKVIPVDEWVPKEEDMIYKSCKGMIRLPVDQYLQVENEMLNTFILSPKRCYNGDEMLAHLPHYMNYFLKFYDQDRELLMVIYRMKYMIDYQPGYTKDMFLNDIKRYILSDNLILKAHLMNEDNYCLGLDQKNYKNDKNPSLQYSDRHAKALMWMSLMVNMMIPLLTHFMFVNKITTNVDKFLLEAYDLVLSYIDDYMGMDIYSKLYDTANSSILKDNKDNIGLWGMQDIRQINPTTHSRSSTINILLNIIPKYLYNNNFIALNYASIRCNTKYQVTGIQYEYNYVPLSSHKIGGEDQTSEFSKFESHSIKQDEALYLQNKVSCEKTMRFIEDKFGPFDPEEVEFYKERLKNENNEVIHVFQKELIFSLFYKYFGDPVTCYGINKDGYVKLMIAATKILKNNNMIILPYIISSKIERYQPRKIVNKKELLKIEASEFYPAICEKYRNEKIVKQLLSIIATILSSEFRIIDFHDKEIDGRKLEPAPDIISEEVLMYSTLI